MDRLQHIVFSGGGTLGHLFPGLAVAAELLRTEAGLRITFAGSQRPLERQHVEAAGLAHLPLACRPWPRQAWRLPAFSYQHLAAVRAAKTFLSRHGADVVVGLGGYASVPMAQAAAALGVPLVLLEQNAIAGRANRWLAGRAHRICLAFAEAGRWLPSAATVALTGNPVREAFLRPQPRDRDKLLLVLGGSGGAAELNEHLPLAAASCRPFLQGWRIVHQAGAAADATRAWYQRLGVAAEVAPFVDEVAAMALRAGLVVSRSGGTTLAELAAAGAPAIVCPLAAAADDHQRRNAERFAAAGACRMVDGRDAPSRLSARLAAALVELLGEASRRDALSEGMRRLARPEAARRVAEVIRHAAAQRPGPAQRAAA